MELVSWNDVQEFISALNELGEGTYRLPTEAEWEYAARAGTTTAFVSGDIARADLNCARNDPNLDEVGWYCYNSNETTHRVNRLDPNAWGLYDMHGNVWEWVSDWFGVFSSSNAVDPTGPTTGTKRVMRGGSWVDFPPDCRSANRNSGSPTLTNRMLGFRVVMEAPQ